MAVKLHVALLEDWDHFPQATIDNLVMSIALVYVVHEANGGHTLLKFSEPASLFPSIIIPGLGGTLATLSHFVASCTVVNG